MWTMVGTLVLAVAAIVAGVIAAMAFAKQNDQLRVLEETQRDQRDALNLQLTALKAEAAEQERLTARQNRLDEERAGLARSEQARQVGAYTVGGGGGPVQVVVVNDSGLPVSHVEALAKAGEHRLPLCGHMGIVKIVNPHSVDPQVPQPPPVAGVAWRMELAFTDDNGVRWHKYGPEPLREVSPDFTLF